jgi:hypothetical protein
MTQMRPSNFTLALLCIALGATSACGMLEGTDEQPLIGPGWLPPPSDASFETRREDAEDSPDASEPGLPDGITSPDVLPPPPQDITSPPDATTSGGCLSYSPPQAMGTLPPSITEASGMVVSATQPDVLWVHNDSGDQARIYAIETGGERLATITLAGTYAYDWEDMAGGPCGNDAECLYVGDVGDNNRVREYLKIHRVPEPDVTLGDQLLTLDDFDTMTVVYPDEPHDCEALVVDRNGHVYLLTKEWDGTRFRLYGSPYLPGSTMTPLQYLSEHDIGDLGGTIPLVTAASFSIPLNRLLVRTYGGAFEYRLAPEANLSDLQFATVQTVPVANEGQGESIAYGAGSYWHVSEGKEPPIWRILCQ